MILALNNVLALINILSQMSIQSVVKWFFYLLGVAAIFGVLFLVVAKLPPAAEPAKPWLRLFLWVALALVIIGIILSMMGAPPFRW